MSDIATLGLAVDSTQVVTATTALDQFASAAKPAADAAAALQSAAAATSSAMATMAPVATSAAVGMTATASGVNALRAAAAPAAVAMAELEATMQAAVGDITVMNVAQANGTTLNGANTESLRGQRLVIAGLAGDLAILGGGLGQYASMAGVLYIQNAHLLEGWGGLQNAIAGLLTPTNLLVGGLAAVAVGGYAAVSSVMAQEKALEDLANQSGATLTELHGLSDAASFKGIDTTDFTKAISQFGTLSYQAVNNMGTLNELFRANGIAAGTTEQNFLNIANLIKNATSSQQQYALLQEAGLPATAQWVALLSQGAQGIKTAAGNAGSFANGEESQLIAKARELGEAFNTSWKNATDSGNSFIVRMLAGLDDIMNSPAWKFMQTAVTLGSYAIGGGAAGRVTTQTPAQTVSSGFNSMNNNYSNPALQKGLNTVAGIPSPQELATLKNNIQLQQELFGILGPLASIDQTVAQKENEINLARLSGVSITKAQESAILLYTQAQALGVNQIRSQADALTVESQAFAMTAGQAAAFTAVQTKINEAYRNGNPLTAQQISYLQQQAQSLNDAAERMDEMRTAQSALSSSFQTFRTDMENGTSAWTALKDSAITALNSISDKLMDMAAKNLVAAAFGGSSGTGSILGSILGVFTGSAVSSGGKLGIGMHSGGVVGTDATFTRYVHPAYFDSAPRFHDGGIAGDEVPIIAKAGEGVFTPAQMAALAPAGAASVAPAPVVNITNNNDFRGTDPSSIARINAALVQTKNQAVSESVSAILKLQKNAPGVARPQ